MGRPPKSLEPRTYAERVGAVIREKRTKRRLSVADAAGRAGVPEPTWYHFEAGIVTLDRLPAIAAALSCSPRSLLP